MSQAACACIGVPSGTTVNCDSTLSVVVGLEFLDLRDSPGTELGILSALKVWTISYGLCGQQEVKQSGERGGQEWWGGTHALQCTPTDSAGERINTRGGACERHMYE